MSRRILATAMLIAATVNFFGLRCSQAQVALDEFGKEPSWKAPSVVEVRTAVWAWLDDRKPEAAVRKQAEALWPTDAASADLAAGDGAVLLERVVNTIALVDPQAKQLTDLCSKPHAVAKTPEFPWLADEKTPAVVRDNLRLWFGKWLAQERLYDEALPQLKDLQPTDVVDPASLLFYQSICHHWMLHKADGLKSIARLLEQKKAIPRRYEQLAELMQSDLTELEDDSLDHISRRMNDVTRRLDFGHAGQKVRGVEDGIVASLDKLIKDLEDMANSQNQQRQQRQQRQRQQGDPNQRDRQGKQDRDRQNPENIRPQNPADESRRIAGKGKGDVKSKNIGNHSGWGDLPAKEKEEAMQQISKEFPSHYRDIIEQYFRKLASEDEEK